MPELDHILVFSEKPSFLAELIGAARGLLPVSGGRVSALVFDAHEIAEEANQYGADRVLWLETGLGSTAMVEECVPTLAHLVEEEKPALVMIGATRRGRTVAGRLAARIGATVITDIQKLVYENGSLQATHMIFGGGAIRVEKPLGDTAVVTVGLGVFLAPGLSPRPQGEIQKIDFIEPEWHVTLRERKIRTATPVDLVTARKIVCLGRGLGKQDDLALMNDLAQALGAEVACTRPLAEGLDWLPRERYIGVSGAQVKPELYLGVGVSGQVQHMVGMSASRIVAAINKDQNAPIFSQADYGIVGDLYTLVPLLIQGLKERK